MARTKGAAPVTRNAADMMVDRLNDTGIPFVRDAWENKAPDDYGVVEVIGQSAALWADDRMLEQVFQLRIHLYVNGSRDDLVTSVQEKLNDICYTYSLPSHEFLFDIAKNHWTWDCHIIGPLQWNEVATGG